VPTRRPRHFVIETEELAAVLDSAAYRRPELSPAELVVKLALEGSRCGDAAVAERR